MDSTFLQNFVASAKPDPKSSIMFNHEFGHKNTNPRKSTTSSIILDPKKRILKLKNLKQKMCYLSLRRGVHPWTPQQLMHAIQVHVSSIPS
jgi:hypothetical protein